MLRPSHNTGLLRIALALALVSNGGCSGFETIADSASDGGVGMGPGPRGALPTGFCCRDDNDCRFRHCVEVNDTKMCLDLCAHQPACEGVIAKGFRCDSKLGRCEPESPRIGCRPAVEFQHGAAKLGDCCARTGNGLAGVECEGYRCSAFGEASNPYICTRACTAGGNECSGPYRCLRTDGARGVCAPLATVYSCPAQ